MSEMAAVSVISITSRLGSAPSRLRQRSTWLSIAGSVTDSAERLIATRGPSRARAEQRGDAGEHEPVDVAHEPVALGRGQEPPGRDERAGGFVGEADERLVVGGAPVGERDDRLVVHGEQVLRQRAAQACEPRTAVQARGRGEVLGETAAVAVVGRVRARACAGSGARRARGRRWRSA